MESVTLPSNIINAMLQYLAAKPYGEVIQLITAIQQEIKKQEPSVSE
jgi:hypothetical protein